MFIDEADPAAATGETAEHLAEEEAFWGFVPGYAHCFVPRPAVARAWRALNGTVRTGMERRDYELASIAAARARRSTYCTVAHSMFLRDVCGDEESVRLIDDDPTGGALSERDAAVFGFATRLATDASAVEQHDVDRLRAFGLGDAEIAGIVYAVAARLFFTTVLDGLGAQLDPQTAARFEPDLLAGMVVGRAVAEGGV